MKIFKASEAKGETFVKALLLGPSGSGKTMCSSKAPMPVILEPASQAVASIRAANSEAQIIPIQSMKDLKDSIYSIRNGNPIEVDGKPALEVNWTEDPSSLNGGRPQHFGQSVIQSVILDDFEEIQEMRKKELQGKGGNLTQQQWGVLLDENMSQLRALRDCRCNVFVCAKVLRVQDGESQVWEISLYGTKLKPLISGLFNCVAFMYKKTRTEQDPREHVAGFKLPEQYATVCKPHPSLSPVEDPDPSIWWEKIRNWENSIGGTEVPMDRTLLPKDFKPPLQMHTRKGSQNQQQRPQQQQQRGPQKPQTSNRR